jgi:hypothetical protein
MELPGFLSYSPLIASISIKQIEGLKICPQEENT